MLEGTKRHDAASSNGATKPFDRSKLTTAHIRAVLEAIAELAPKSTLTIPITL
jgi:hypothetical protein